MTDRSTPALENFQSLLNAGFSITNVDSTDTDMVVTLRRGDNREMVTFGPNEAEIIFQATWLDETAEPIPA